MVGQNILRFYGSKLDLKLDSSEEYDFIIDKSEWVDLQLDNSLLFDLTVDTTGWVDLVLDYSELYDFQLDNSVDLVDYTKPITYETKIYEIDGTVTYAILTQDNYVILAQNGEYIQFQH